MNINWTFQLTKQANLKWKLCIIIFKKVAHASNFKTEFVECRNTGILKTWNIEIANLSFAHKEDDFPNKFLLSEVTMAMFVFKPTVHSRSRTCFLFFLFYFSFVPGSRVSLLAYITTQTEKHKMNSSLFRRVWRTCFFHNNQDESLIEKHLQQLSSIPL